MGPLGALQSVCEGPQRMMSVASPTLILAGGTEPAVGTNKRYAHRYDQMTEERILEAFVIKHGPLQSLTPEESELDRLPLTIYPDGHRPKVKA